MVTASVISLSRSKATKPRHPVMQQRKEAVMGFSVKNPESFLMLIQLAVRVSVQVVITLMPEQVSSKDLAAGSVRSVTLGEIKVV